MTLRNDAWLQTKTVIIILGRRAKKKYKKSRPPRFLRFIFASPAQTTNAYPSLNLGLLRERGLVAELLPPQGGAQLAARTKSVSSFRARAARA